MAYRRIGTVKKLGRPTEPVAPADEKIWNRVSLTNVVLPSNPVAKPMVPDTFLRACCLTSRSNILEGSAVR
jgi:hypothetical protein